MMSELKCPFCQKQLECCGIYIDGTKKLWCDNCGLFGDNRLFEALIRTHKALDRAKLILKNLLPDLNGYERLDVEKAIAEITALEQKDVK